MKATWTTATMAAAAMALTLACGGEKPSPAPPATTGGPAATTAGAPPMTAAPATAAPATTTAGGVGVPECDSYLTKLEACVQSHVPDAQKAQMRQALDESRQVWRTAAANPETRSTLATVCKQAETAQRVATAVYGCQW
jgi:hypothetical protein